MNDEELPTAIPKGMVRTIALRPTEYRLVVDAAGSYRLQASYEWLDSDGVHGVEWRDIPNVHETGRFV